MEALRQTLVEYGLALGRLANAEADVDKATETIEELIEQYSASNMLALNKNEPVIFSCMKAFVNDITAQLGTTKKPVSFSYQLAFLYTNDRHTFKEEQIVQAIQTGKLVRGEGGFAFGKTTVFKVLHYKLVQDNTNYLDVLGYFPKSKMFVMMRCYVRTYIESVKTYLSNPNIKVILKAQGSYMVTVEEKNKRHPWNKDILRVDDVLKSSADKTDFLDFLV